MCGGGTVRRVAGGSIFICLASTVDGGYAHYDQGSWRLDS